MSDLPIIPEDKIKSASQGLRAIAHELRLSVLCLLLERPMCVHELIEATGAAQSNLSQHLSKMRMLGILESEKRGQEVMYSIANPDFAELVNALKQIYCPEMVCAAPTAKEG
ncbi:ArsR family transcriptional regulator [Mariprofundus micogutta]|uniref:ArsR family transcriptional regulator n=1 Tax=Mariprofundus micogutta TaxID=1921010 RepID=A0A1L8CP83_9PROT|nr:metalloregulator ArsR/SmtB family transcription factor [Mariprofundus micogutta]GAV20730.1 ArsR family transcriptional regulator [Mariprofundus micogutta]